MSDVIANGLLHPSPSFSPFSRYRSNSDLIWSLSVRVPVNQQSLAFSIGSLIDLPFFEPPTPFPMISTYQSLFPRGAVSPFSRRLPWILTASPAQFFFFPSRALSRAPPSFQENKSCLIQGRSALRFVRPFQFLRPFFPSKKIRDDDKRPLSHRLFP